MLTFVLELIQLWVIITNSKSSTHVQLCSSICKYVQIYS